MTSLAGAFRRRTVPLECPECGYVTDTTIRDIELEVSYPCAGCRSTIRLVDDDFSARVALRRIAAGQDQLRRAFGRIGTR